MYASWNGATTVGNWRVLAGTSPTTLAPVTTVTRNGFETAIAMPGPEPYVQVQALDVAGNLLGTSNVIKG